MNYASWPKRVLAAIVDGLIVTVIAVPVLILLIAVAAGAESGSLVVLSIVFFFAVGVLYAPVLMQRPGERNGQTWGKQLIGIRVVRDDGEEVSFGYALLREFLIKGLVIGWLGGLLWSIPTIINYLWPLWDKENRALHDMMAKSHVLGADAPPTVGEANAGEPKQPPAPDPAERQDV